MAQKNTTYINVELQWASEQLESWKKYVDANPIHKLKDRARATIEQQGKFLQDTMKNYLQLLEVVDKLREKEDKKQQQIRGDQNLTPFESGDI